MSTSHHGTPDEIAAKNRLLDQFLERAVPAFPAGHLNKDDEGELSFAIAVDKRNGVIVIRFGKSVDWLGLKKHEAEHMGRLLLEKAASL